MRFSPASDEEGMKRAIVEMMEESFVRERLAGQMLGADEEHRQKAIARQMPERTLSEGYYKVGAYLCWLSRQMEAGVPPEALLSFEAVGLRAVEDARLAFRNAHPSCGGCGALQDGRFSVRCHECGMEFRKRA
jgi:hypothetical protein